MGRITTLVVLLIISVIGCSKYVTRQFILTVEDEYLDIVDLGKRSFVAFDDYKLYLIVKAGYKEQDKEKQNNQTFSVSMYTVHASDTTNHDVAQVDSITCTFYRLEERGIIHVDSSYMKAKLDEYNTKWPHLTYKGITFDSLQIPPEVDSIRVQFTTSLTKASDSSTIIEDFDFTMYRYDHTIKNPKIIEWMLAK